ncbi:hypothetical protein CKO14_05450 [Halorhodospira halophila]|nr:hypothetical protein [Halorhodospira halophila]
MAGQARKPVLELEQDGRKLVVKFPDDKGRSWIKSQAMRMSASTMAGERLPLEPFQMAAPGPRVLFEAGRLDALRRAGAPVPRLVGVKANRYLVMEAAGTPLERQLRRATEPRAACGDQVVAAAELLGSLHAQGHWHGAPRIRNVLVDEAGAIHLIDFEEDLRAVPAEVCAANDIVKFLSSLVILRGKKHPPQVSLAEEALVAYLQTAGGAQARGCLERYQSRSRRIQGVMAGVARWVGGDARRIAALGQALRGGLERTAD